MLASFEERDFRRIWLGAVLFGLGMWSERLAIGWFVLDETGSVLLAATSFAIRTAPNLVLGPIGGTVADRFPRARVLASAASVRVAAALAMAAVVFVDVATVPLLLALVFVSGSMLAFYITSLQPLQAEIVGSERLGNAVSLTSLGQQTVGVAGSLAGGLFLGWLGPGPTLLAGAVPLALAALLFASVDRPAPSVRGDTKFAADIVEGLRALVATPTVRLLLAMMVFVEILGFSVLGMLPAVAERVLEVGPERLGVLTAGVTVGAMFGTLALVAGAERLPRGPFLVAVFGVFGVLIVALGHSSLFWLSVVVAAGIGASTAMVDALEWMMLQSAVPDRLRGRAIGGWNFAIGWGWVGTVGVGALGDAAGVPAALTVTGSLLLGCAVLLAIFAAPIRRA